MDPAQESEIRARLGERIGRPLTDDEWEGLKRYQPELVATEAATSTAKGEPASRTPTVRTDQDRGAIFLGVLSLLVAVGLLFEVGFLLSPVVKVLVGIFAWLVSLAMFSTWLRGGGCFGWWVGLFLGLFVGVPLLVAGWALIFEDREFLVSEWEWIRDFWNDEGTNGSPAQVAGMGLGVAGIALFLMGWVGWNAETD